jgi:hypothetical protein
MILHKAIKSAPHSRLSSPREDATRAKGSPNLGRVVDVLFSLVVDFEAGA